jgi:hypothetical protein
LFVPTWHKPAFGSRYGPHVSRRFAEVRLYFLSEADAREAAREIVAEGLTVSVERPIAGQGWSVVVGGDPAAVLAFRARWQQQAPGE